MIKITIEGPPASGKSRLATWLWRNLPAHEISVDDAGPQLRFQYHLFGSGTPKKEDFDRIEVYTKQN